jgi:hypothetical protein
MMGSAALLCVMGSLEAVAGSYVMTDSTIRTAVSWWLSDSAAAEAMYGHISTWETSGVTDMAYLFSACNWDSRCNTAAASFNEDIGAWDTSGVTTMEDMFWEASAFNQDLGWCVDDGVNLVYAFRGTPCESTSCGVLHTAALSCGGKPMGDGSIRTAVAAWFDDRSGAEATYGHISTWATGGVTDMSNLFSTSSNSGAEFFNEDIGAWDTSGVTAMSYMFYGASAFDQDLGWCLDDDVYLGSAFTNTPCEATSCGVVWAAAARCGGDGAVLDDTTIETAVRRWLEPSTKGAAEATYGHISTWETGGVTDMSRLFCAESLNGCVGSAAASFNEDISVWDTSGVTAMRQMFYGASAFNRDIGGWAVDSVLNMDSMFRSAYAFNQDIGGWSTEAVTDMRNMFDKASLFNQPVGGWSVEAVKSMGYIFADASAFDQDLGWCVDDGVSLAHAFLGTSCDSNACGVGQKDAIGICEPWARPCLIAVGREKNPQCIMSSPTLIIAIVLILLAGFGACVCCRKKKDETYVAAARRLLCCRRCQSKMESSSVTSPRPDSPAELPRDEPDEEATAPESLETRAQAAAAKAKAAETVERPGLTRKLSSFLFGEQEEEPTALAVAEAEVAATEQPPPPPARRTEPEPTAKSEEMYNQIAAWYNGPENAALRATWGAYPEPDAFQTWPGFVAVTNAFLDREAG